MGGAVPQRCLEAWGALHQPCGDSEREEGTHHSDGLHIPVYESEETLSAQGHLLLLLAHIGFLGALSTSWLQFRPEAWGRETGVASSASKEQQVEGGDDR